LRLYHQIELLFDWVVVKQIQALGSDLTGIGRLMSDYAAGDTPRLRHIISKYSTDTDRLLKRMFDLPKFVSTAKAIFQDYSKESNPLKDNWTKFIDWAENGTPDLVGAKKFKLAPDQAQFDTLVRTTAAYWIYRVRCCIAHNKIGEYILQDSDEDFVINFIEPLLQEVLLQVLANPALPR
jgi:hypothetical protein